MGRAEYVVQFKGDYSALQKDINKINGETRKLADDEVIIKLNYDGNIKEFNKVFDKISKSHPELGIQFQYNVNQKILEQELGKLDQLTELKLDVDNGKVQEKLEKMADGIESALQNKLSKDEITKQLTEYFGYYNTAIKAGAKRIDIDSINNRLVESFEIEEDEIKKIFDNVFDSNASKPYQLFKLDTSINEEINITKDRVQDLKDTIKSLEERGASKTGLPSDLQKVQDEIKILRSDIQDMQEQLKNLSGDAFNEMTENIKNTNEQLNIAKDRLKIIQDFLKNNGNSEMLNFTEALNKLQGMLSVFYKENNGNHISSFWDELIAKAQDGDAEVLQLLSDLHLLKDTKLPEKINAGMVKSGGLIGDDYTVLTTKIHSDKFSGDRLKDAEELKKKLDAISDSGVNAAKTLAIVSDEASNLFVEIQETAPGKMLGQIYGQTEKDWVNTDFFEATDAEILKLIVDLETLRKAGIGVELNAGNLLYEKGKGFTIIDMDLEPLKDYEETISEAQNVLFDSIRQFYELQTDESGNITAEAQTAITALDNFSQKFGDIAEKKKAVIDQLSTAGASNQQITINDAAKEATQKAADAVQQAQDSNSPAELTKPLGNDFGAGYAEGIREAIPEVVKACKEVVLAAYNAVKETSDAENREGNNLLDNFINNFKESLNNALPAIQEKIKEVFSKIDIENKNEKTPLSSIASEDFQTQFQNTIDETGKYIIRVYGELIDDFKSRLQNSIDETGIYHIDIEGWLYDTFHDGLQRDIDGQEKYIIEVKGRLFDTFKEVLQEAIDGLGAFPIEVKPYMRKGGEIEEVDLPGGNQNNLLSEGTTTPSQIDEVTDNIIEFKKKQEETTSPDLRNGYERMADSISELGSEYDEAEKYATELLHAVQEIQDINKLSVLDDSQYNRMQEIYEQFPEVVGFLAKYPQYMKGWVNEDYVDDWFTFLETLPKAKEFLKVQEQISDFVNYDERVSNGGVHFDDEYLEEINQQLQQATGKEENFIEKYKEIIDLFSSGKIGEIQTIKSILEKEMPYYNYYVSEDTGFIKGIPKTRKEIEELGLSAEETSHIIEELYGKTKQSKTKSNGKIVDASHLFGRPSNKTPVSTERSTANINAETEALAEEETQAKATAEAKKEAAKAGEDTDLDGLSGNTESLLTKKQVIEQLRSELNLTKKAAKELFKAQDYKNPTGIYQIEQSAVTELISSLKEKKQIEESTTPTTSSATDNIQSEVNAVNQAIDTEKKKFDELKNKISKAIPDAIKKKNDAFKEEAELVSKLVGGEAKEFDNLKGSVDGVTDAVKESQKVPKDTESKTKTSSNTSGEVDKDALLKKHYTDLRRDAFQSIGQKSQIQQDMSEYYAQLEKDSTKAYSDAEKKANSLLDKVKKLQSSNKYTQDFVEELNIAENELTNFLKELSKGDISFDEVDSRVEKLSKNIETTLSRKAFGSVKQAAEKSLTNVGLKIDQIIAKNSAMGKDFEARFKKLRKDLNGAQSIEAVQKIIAEVNKLESELIATGNTGKSFIDQIKQRLRDINSKYIAQYFSFQDIIRYARQAATNVIQLNDAFIELSKVSNTSLETLERDFQSYADIAHDIGGTITDTINATADWARMGYSVPDSKQLAEVAMLYKNVGDGISIDDANSSLISTLQGYQMQADEAEHIVDVFNEVANNYAIDTAGIGEALQRSAASLNAANTSLEESVALVTAANTVVQNPESVGTTFKTLSARIRGASTELEELGEEGDEFTETTSKLQGLVKSLTGFDILESDQKTFKSIYDILIGIGKEWKNLDDIERASLGEALAGKRNANTLYAVLDNIETLENAYKTAEESAGSAQREQENYQKGITYSINQAKAELEELSYDLINSDFLKGLINTGTKVIELVDKLIDKFGTFRTLLTTIGTIWGSKKLG